METQLLKRKELVNRKKLSIAERSVASSDGRCSFPNAFYSDSLEDKNKALDAYYFHKSRIFDYPYSDLWVSSWEHSVKEL